MAHEVVDSLLAGYNGTIFAYGQVGTREMRGTCMRRQGQAGWFRYRYHGSLLAGPTGRRPCTGTWGMALGRLTGRWGLGNNGSLLAGYTRTIFAYGQVGYCVGED